MDYEIQVYFLSDLSGFCPELFFFPSPTNYVYFDWTSAPTSSTDPMANATVFLPAQPTGNGMAPTM